MKSFLLFVSMFIIFGCQSAVEKKQPAQVIDNEIQQNSCQEYFYLMTVQNGISNANGEVIVHTDLNDSLFISPKLICSLHVSSNWETRFPIELYNFPNLEYLWLGMRNIETLPNDFIQLKKLKHLDLQHSPLKALPENIGELQDLEQLTLLGTDIMELPNSICHLKNLKKIHLGMSKIKRLPICLKNISSLKTVIAFDEEGNLPDALINQIEILKKEMPNCEFSL